jgi:hypothetical protein
MEKATEEGKCIIVTTTKWGTGPSQCSHDGWCLGCKKGIQSDIATHMLAKNHIKFEYYWQQGPLMRKSYTAGFLDLCRDNGFLVPGQPFVTERMYSTEDIMDGIKQRNVQKTLWQ